MISHQPSNDYVFKKYFNEYSDRSKAPDSFLHKIIFSESFNEKEYFSSETGIEKSGMGPSDLNIIQTHITNVRDEMDLNGFDFIDLVVHIDY